MCPYNSKKTSKNQKLLYDIPNQINDIFFLIDYKINVNYLNEKAKQFFGISNKKFIKMSLYEVIPKLKNSEIEESILKTFKTKQSQSTIIEYEIKDKKSFFNITTHPVGEEVSILIRDINEEIKTENLQKLGILILKRLNISGDFKELIRDVILLIKTYTKFDAVGLRLRDGVDYPYYITDGFSSNFIKTENSLCAKTKTGKIIIDEKGNPLLECMCGNIIMARTDPKLPFFTKGGSFWTNSTTKLLATTNQKDLQTHTRNRCNTDGYESVALIPLISDKKIIGLLQLNDKRKNMLSLNNIQILEGYAASIATAITRDKAIKDLEISEQRYYLAQQSANIGCWDWDIEKGDLVWSEKIEPIFGFKKGKFKGTYEAFLESVHPEDRNLVIKSVDDCLKYKKKYAIEHRIIWPDGTIRWVFERGDVIRDKKDKPIRMLGVVQDITDKKDMENKLKQKKEDLEKIVEERTSELIKINKKLEDEIVERKKAESYIQRTKENLRNVIDSASELIISFDMNNRISTWNKTAEKITGYKQIEVLNRSVGKLEVFDNPETLVENIQMISSKKPPKFIDMILKTKENDKRILRVNGTEILSQNKKYNGVLFIGKDITKEIELHKQLIGGNSYLINDKNIFSSIDLLVDLAINDFKGLIITRGNPDHIKIQIPEIKNVELVLLTTQKHIEYINISDLNKLKDKINNFSNKNNKTVILLDGTHYLLTRFSFNEFIEFLFNINDIVAKNKAILFVRIDPSTIDNTKLAVLENELLILPSQKTKDLIINDESFNMLKYIYDQNQNNAIVSFKKITSRFEIAYLTAANKIRFLEEKGLIITKKEGKFRTIYITDKGKSMLHKRQFT